MWQSWGSNEGSPDPAPALRHSVTFNIANDDTEILHSLHLLTIVYQDHLIWDGEEDTKESLGKILETTCMIFRL